MRTVVLAVLAVVIGAVLALEVYARVPAGFEVRPLLLQPGTERVVLIFHGRGGAEEPTIRALTERFESLAGGHAGIAVVRYIWSPHSDTRFRSAINGAHVGAALGQELAGLPALSYLHLIGHSAGVYPMEALCEALRATAVRNVHVEMTFLDPIGFAGSFDTGYGARNFGRCADYAEAFINTDDPVPATRKAFRHAWNIDVTRSPERAGYDGGGHRWPARYYLDHLTSAALSPGDRDHRAHPRGAVKQL
jgi:hypothetical protein